MEKEAISAKRRKKRKGANRSGPAEAASLSADRATPAWRQSRRRRWAFRIVAVTAAPVLFLLLLEAALRLFGYGHPTSFTLTAEVNGRQCRVPNLAFGWRFFPRAPRRRQEAPPGRARRDFGRTTCDRALCLASPSHVPAHPARGQAQQCHRHRLGDLVAGAAGGLHVEMEDPVSIRRWYGEC